jgi:hypothetical protein
MSSSYGLRERKEKNSRENHDDSDSDKKVRKHRRTRALTDDEEQENEEPAEEGVDVIEPSAKAKSVVVSVSFGERAVSDDLGNISFYACDSKGAKSPSQHVKGTIKVAESLNYNDLVPTVRGLLLDMKPIPVTLDFEKHIIMLPMPTAEYLDERSDALRYHKLQAIDEDTWTCDGASVAVAVFEKVLYK